MGLKAMIFAAGMGTRLRPLTDNKPKALIEVGGKPLIAHVMERLVQAGFDELVVNVHHCADQLIGYLKEWNAHRVMIHISDERNLLLDTGGGIKHVRTLFTDNTPFLIHNTDILSNLDLQAFYRAHLNRESAATLLVSQRNTSRYLLFDASDRLQGWINRKSGETKPLNKPIQAEQLTALAFNGIHVFSPTLFDEMEHESDRFSIIDFYLSCCDRYDIHAYRNDDSDWLDVGKIEVLEAAEAWCKRHG